MNQPLMGSGPGFSFPARISGFLLIISVSLLGGLPAHASRVATSTTLTVTSGGSAVTTASSGAVVTFTATVTAGATPITTGQVAFCDATATRCSDIHLVGMAQLTSAGTAVFKFRPALGGHTYKAVFNGTASDAPSTSSTAPLLVSGAPLTTTLIAQSGSTGNYQLTATVVGAGTTAPTGTVSFLDSSNSNAVRGTAALGNSASGFALVNSWTGTTGPLSSTPLVGDLNGDGILDMVVSDDTKISVFLGNGDGTFSSASINAGGQAALAVGDFNCDGILDLIVTSGNLQSDTITVWQGNGDGTFTSTGTTASIGAAGSTPVSVTVGDLNGDGILDLAAVVREPAGNGYSLSVLLGNGDGTFSPAKTPLAIGGFVLGDFNGDGILDLAAINTSNNSLSILLGNGDGTFSPVTASPSTGNAPSDIVVGDFNGDGKLDLAVSNSQGSTVTVLLGNGDGTFTPAASSPATGMFPFALLVGDFNGDGKADLFVLANQGVVSVLLGNGDGTFTSTGSNLLEVDAPELFAAGDFNGDARTDIAVVIADGGVTAQLAEDQSATATAAQIAVPVATGTHQVVASYPGNSNFKASTSEPTALASAMGTPTVVAIPSANPVPYGAAETLTATVTGSGLTPTGAITFVDGTKQLGTGVLSSSGTAKYSSATLSVGSHSITATYAGDSNYAGATSAAVALTVAVPTGTVTSTLTATPSATTINSQQTDTVTVSVAGAAGQSVPTGVVALTSGPFSAVQPLASGATSFAIAAGTLSNGANTLTATYSGDTMYAGSSATTTVTVSAVVITVPAPSAVSAGTSATANITLAADATYSGTMNVSCSLTGSPTGAQSLPTCSLNPAAVAIALGGSGTSVLTVNTTAASGTASITPSNMRPWKLGSGATLLVGLLLVVPSSRRRRCITMLVSLSVIAVVLAIGCGGGSSPKLPATPATTAGNYVFAVSASDSANAKISASTSVTIVVQ
jgi:hypothetical protein